MFFLPLYLFRQQSVADESIETDRILEDLIKTTTGLRQGMESSSGILHGVFRSLKSSITQLDIFGKSVDTVTDSVEDMNNVITESSETTSKLADVATSIDDLSLIHI